MGKWFDKHRYHFLTAFLVILTAVFIVWYFRIGQVDPDVQVAFVCAKPLTPETVTALEEAFTEYVGDYNKDGRVLVKVNTYTGIIDRQLQLDIQNRTSFLFVMDKPLAVQRVYQILATENGKPPIATDFSVDDKVQLWADHPALSNMKLGTVKETYDRQTYLGDLYVGRRYYYVELTPEFFEEWGELWNTLMDVGEEEEEVQEPLPDLNPYNDDDPVSEENTSEENEERLLLGD